MTEVHGGGGEKLRVVRDLAKSLVSSEETSEAKRGGEERMRKRRSYEYFKSQIKSLGFGLGLFFMKSTS